MSEMIIEIDLVVPPSLWEELDESVLTAVRAGIKVYCEGGIAVDGRDENKLIIKFDPDEHDATFSDAVVTYCKKYNEEWIRKEYDRRHR